jgi:hypothetical protein
MLQSVSTPKLPAYPHFFQNELGACENASKHLIEAAHGPLKLQNSALIPANLLYSTAQPPCERLCQGDSR